MIILVINIVVIIIFIACLYLLKRFDANLLDFICTSSFTNNASDKPDKNSLNEEEEEEEKEEKEKDRKEKENGFQKDADNYSLAASEVDSFSSSLELDISIDEHMPLFGDSKVSRIKHRIRDTEMHHHHSHHIYQDTNHHHSHHERSANKNANHNSFPNYSYRLLSHSSSKQTSSNRHRKPLKKENSIDLVSMAEKGNICKPESLDGTSSLSSESATPDTEDDMGKPLMEKKCTRKSFPRLTTVREVGRLNRFYSEEKADNRITVGRLKLSNSLDQENILSLSSDTFSSTRMLLDSHSNINCSTDDDSIIMPKEIITDDGPVGRWGAIQVSHAYDPPTKKLYITIVKAVIVPTIKDKYFADNENREIFVKIVLLPNWSQKYRTKNKLAKNGVADFGESFTFNRISPEVIHSHGLRYRIFVSDKIKRVYCLGEYILPFSTHKPFIQEVKLWLNMEAITSTMNKSDSKSDVSSLTRSDSTGSNHSMQKECSPELLLGLSYNGTTGRLQVFIIRGCQFRSAKSNKSPDTFVKLSLLSFHGQEISRSKTLIQKGQLNPHFNESVIFPITLFQLPDVTLVVSVYNKRTIKGRELIGWFSLGRNNTGEEEKIHWNDMREHRGEQICRWHVLLDS